MSKKSQKQQEDIVVHSNEQDKALVKESRFAKKQAIPVLKTVLPP